MCAVDATTKFDLLPPSGANGKHMEYGERHKEVGCEEGLYGGVGEAGKTVAGMMHIEVGEHRRLLGLYYAVYAEHENPTQESARERLRALEACNRFYEGGGGWRL